MERVDDQWRARRERDQPQGPAPREPDLLRLRRLAHELAKQGLADEMHFWVNPTVRGSGDRAFHGRQVRMRLIATTAFNSGVVLLSYRPVTECAGERNDLTSPGLSVRG